MVMSNESPLNLLKLTKISYNFIRTYFFTKLRILDNFFLNILIAYEVRTLRMTNSLFMLILIFYENFLCIASKQIYFYLCLWLECRWFSTNSAKDIFQ
jgi:hypothetical protein